MAIQTASAALITTFKSAVIGLRIKTTDIFELGSSTNNPIAFVLGCVFVRRQGGIIVINMAFACEAARNNMPGFRIAGFLNKSSLRTDSPTTDTFFDNNLLTEAQKNYGINLISRAVLNIRVPTRITIDISKITLPIANLTQYTVELDEGFFRQNSRVSTDPLLTNTNNQMPTIAALPLVSLLTNSRPFFSLYSPSNGTTTAYTNHIIQLLPLWTRSNGQSGYSQDNPLSRGTGFFRLYEEGVLQTSVSVQDSTKVTFTNNNTIVNVSFLGYIEANKNYYVLVDNGVVVDTDGFASQAVVSTTQLYFRTAPSTDPQFPDLSALEMSAANLLLPQSEIMIYFSSDSGTFSTVSCDAEIVRYATGTTTSTATIIATPERTVRTANLSPMTFALTASVNLVQAYGRANVTASSSLSLPFFQRNRQHYLDPVTYSSTASVLANPGIPLTLVYNNPTTLGLVIRGADGLAVPGSDINITVDWGDGTIQTFTGSNNTGSGNTFNYTREAWATNQTLSSATSPTWNERNVRYIQKTYSGNAVRTVRITGSFAGIQHNANGVDLINGDINTGSLFIVAGAKNLIRCDSWGDVVGLRDLEGAFAYCHNLTTVPNRLPTGTRRLAYMFAFTKFNGAEIGSWNTSQVTTMAGMFRRNTYFNQPIGSWNTSQVTTFSYMFNSLQAGGPINAFYNGFNQNINTWNTGSATNMFSMFAYSNAYNQPMNNWNVSNVTNMDEMFFAQTITNQNLSNWCVQNIAARPFRWNTASTQTGFGNMVGANEPIWGTCP